ncbi:hypothetical protein C3L50_07525 [Flavobacterium alvei]|uniref:Uncharacterized protein n=1 Tax=Flavobacterium alvei TaxID=2080416 RepID=A0A2S5ADI2_9FLAO|nr:hypothetical protein C3L50_07525 [Flavobacterium alvei]
MFVICQDLQNLRANKRFASFWAILGSQVLFLPVILIRRIVFNGYCNQVPSGPNPFKTVQIFKIPRVKCKNRKKRVVVTFDKPTT